VNNPDIEHAVQLADRIWWVGHLLPGDDFQCHAYLIEQGDQSVLVDPGSQITFQHTLAKIEEVVPFSNIRWFVCHHQDPDITSALPIIDRMVTREDARIVSHWRAEALIKHYGIRLPFWLVEDNGWQLQLPQRLLRFIFTPYAHFPGAFCSFDSASGVLFSSDLFGGFTTEPRLFAEDADYFEAIRPFHEHYIPSHDVLSYALTQIEKQPVRMIAPQHGSVIPEHLVQCMIDKLKSVECGLYLMAQQSTDIQRLSRLNATLKDITSTMIVSRDFREIADRLLAILQRMLPAESLEFHAQLEGDRVLHLAPETRYRGVTAAPPEFVSHMFGINRESWEASALGGASFKVIDINDASASSRQRMLLPLFKEQEDWMYGVALVNLSEPVQLNDDIHQMMSQMSAALQVAVEREAIYRSIEFERQKFYERSIRDPLTGLFTRFYMEDTLRRLFEIQDRNYGAPVALAMLDIDHFKQINDRYGHVRGDEVLRQVAAIIKADARAGDLPVRLGGEEFGIFVIGESVAEIPAIAGRLRRRVAAIRFQNTLSDLRPTVSVGTAVRQPGESILGFIERADLALYRAKHQGRNRVCCADRDGHAAQGSLPFD
jgi:diguanylate cyclase (GGDEF)-like protein